MKVTATVTDPPVVDAVDQTDVWSDYVDDHWPTYSMDVTINGQTYHLQGWVFCGMIMPGAHGAPDGSGLSQWGSSQPGGWWQSDDDGQFSGLPVAEAHRDAVVLWSGDHLDGKYTIPVPGDADADEWAREINWAIVAASPSVAEPTDDEWAEAGLDVYGRPIEEDA